MSDNNEPLVRVDGLSVHFPVRNGLFGRTKRTLRAVNELSLTLNKGECLSVVGESGCGKSTLALSILGLQEPTAGEIFFEGRSITGKAQPTRLERAGMAQMVFQDPYASLNPRQTIYTSLAAPLKLHGVKDRAEINRRIESMMQLVGLKPEQARRFPHEFSGGQRQRIGIARALILNPKVVVLDEPVSALDVSIRAQIINLLLELKERLDLSYIMISHDLSVVEHMSDRVAVMYFGQIVETGSWDRVFTEPQHPYTRRLIGAILDPVTELTGQSPVDTRETPEPPAGYDYYPREFGKHDVYSLPPASQLVALHEDHSVRLIARV
ncbi:peptide/nickel transport system ATP-binding protein [Ensifer adhaerens]|uniref:Peptide/nickel transport system ATP-binding protein n=1 Tax=Ensifer adhaerens TaxID=106592 RepID=A0ACC5T6N2_ENSAD|nr:ATP-binding cassette domain-containing protein [Ensifer adhaerens]MBP1876374.1 peptide/nickel transport system ATP-binding protein [Ensifer adhaerens]